MTILAVGGYAESGKDAFVDSLESLFDYRRTFMSKPLMNALLTLDPKIPLILPENRFALGPQAVPYSQLHAEVGYAASKKEPEVRRLLQILGTEIGRHMFGEDVWVNLILEEIDATPAGFWAVTGVRYQNELDVLKTRDAISVWIYRPGVTPINAHSSDNSLYAADFDYVVHNDLTLGDLHFNAQTFHQQFVTQSRSQ